MPDKPIPGSTPDPGVPDLLAALEAAVNKAKAARLAAQEAKDRDCPTCKGGNLQGVAPCRTCDGAGRIRPARRDES